MADENQPTFGPYELRPGVNRLMFGADPVVTLERAKSFSTKEPGIAAFLDEHPDVRRKKAPAKKGGARKAASSSDGGENA